MDVPTFRSLCAELKYRVYKGGQEQVICGAITRYIFMYVDIVNDRLAADRFQHSTETIHRHFKIMMKRVLCRLAMLIIQPPDLNVIPLEIRNNPKRYPWFKDCIGAIDDTHIAAHAPARKRSAYCGWKVAITQNVLVVCSFDMKFTFVYPCWEGSAIDSRVLSDALTCPDVSLPLPLTGKYYLVDAGYTNMTGFLAPNRLERYHLDQFCGRRRCPNGYKELFNYLHSLLRNVIEQCFGAVEESFFYIEIHVELHASATRHNSYSMLCLSQLDLHALRK